MFTAWPCPLCKRNITGVRAKAAHYKHLWKAKDDPTRCDNVALVNVPVIVNPLPEDDCTFDDDPGPVATATACEVSLTNEPSGAAVCSLARRPAKNIETSRAERSHYHIEDARLHTRKGTFDMLRTQKAWDRYCVGTA